jgi:Ca-activated chloride channel family protein
MGRHANPTARRRPAPPVLLAAGLAAVLIAGGLVWWLTGSDETCETRQTVAVTVAPELGQVTERLLADPIALDDGICAEAEVSAQEPLQTVGDLGALEDDALPDVWAPDSSLWAARTGGTPLEEAGSLGSSPVVIATSRAVADTLGWTGAAPSWGQALATDRPLAVPDLAASAEGLSALAAVRSSLGGGPEADNAVVSAVLAAARSTVITPADALAAGSEGSPDAPLVPVSEQEVYAINEGATESALVAVYPSEGSPTLDYPVLRVGEHSGTERSAVDAVIRVLTSERARDAVREAGFRDSDGGTPPEAGPRTGTQEAAPEAVALDSAEVLGLFDRLSSLARPSRLLAVFDVSASMEAAVGDGTRATLARDAAKSALTLFPDSSAIGLWVFARHLNGPTDWVELVPTRPLDADTGGKAQRDLLLGELDSIPGRLAPGGTGLYDSTLAAVRAARADFDPTAVSSVVVITDGRDEDGDSIGLDALVATLSAEADPTRPVKVIAIGLGPDADLAALEQVGAATGGAAYSAVDENDLQAVLFDALRQRS